MIIHSQQYDASKNAANSDYEDGSTKGFH